MTYYEAYSKCNIDEFVAMVKTDKAFAEYYDPDKLKCIDDAVQTVIVEHFADNLAYPYEMYDLLGEDWKSYLR